MMYHIADEKVEFKDGKMIITTIAAGDIGYANELQYIKYQKIIDVMTKK